MRRSSIRPILIILAILLAAPLCLAQEEVTDQDSNEEYPGLSFFVGSYTLIGKVLEGDATFMGLLVLQEDSTGSRSFQRIIGADTLSGTWGMEYAIGAEARVIRIRWLHGERKFECTYQWSSDFDSYPRLSGHCYETGKATDSPGMEVGFAIWPDWGEEDGNDDSGKGSIPQD
ncbi:MAG: hypothetical protein WBQ23_09900 [Bacteroidota bacterium]